jgi:hypothetical protein
MDVQPGPVRRAHRAEPLTPAPIILPVEAIAVMLLILVLALGLMIRSGTQKPAVHCLRRHLNDFALNSEIVGIAHRPVASTIAFV